MGHCGCKNGMKKGMPCGCATCRGQRSKSYSRRIDGNTFIGSKIPVQRNIANALANRIRNNGNNARVIPAKDGYRVYVNPNRRYNHPIKMMQVVPNVFNRDRNQNGIYDSVEKLLMPKKPRTYDREVGVVRNQDIVALGLQAPQMTFDTDRTKDMIESRFGKAVSEDWLRRYADGDGESVLDGRIADNRLLNDNLRNGGLRTNKDRPDMFYQLTSLADMPEEKQIEMMNDLYGNTSKLYKELGAVDYDIDFEDSTIRYFVPSEEYLNDSEIVDKYLTDDSPDMLSDKQMNSFMERYERELVYEYEDEVKAKVLREMFGDMGGSEREIELTFDDLLLDHDDSGNFQISNHVSKMIDSPYNTYGEGQTTSLIEATQYYRDDLQAMIDDIDGGKTKIERIEEWLKAEIKDNEYSGMAGDQSVEDGRAELAERVLDQINRKFLKDRVQRSDENKLMFITNMLKTEIEDNKKSLMKNAETFTQTDFQYGINEAARELLEEIGRMRMREDFIDEAINDEYQSLSEGMMSSSMPELERELKEQLDNTSYWSLIRSAYMNRLRDYDRRHTKESFQPHMMYDPKTGQGKLAETYEDHLKWKKQGWTHTGYARRISDADRYKRPQKYLGISYYIDPSSGMVELPANAMQNVPYMMFDNEQQVRDYITKLKAMSMPKRMRGIKRNYNSHGGGDIPSMAIANKTFIPLFRGKPPSKDDEMYYESKEGGRIGKRKYIMKTIDGDDWYGYYVDNLGRRVE